MRQKLIHPVITVRLPPYGESAPPGKFLRRLNKATGWTMVALSILALLSLFWSNFVPSPATVRATMFLAIFAGLFYGAAFLGIGRFGWDANHPRVQAAMCQSRIARWPWLRVPFMALTFAAFAWMSFSSTVPWAFNLIVGSEGTMTVIVDGWEDESFSFKSGRSCARPTVQGIPFGMLGRQALCVPSERKSKFPSGALLILEGRASVLGISARRYKVVSGMPEHS